MTRRTALAHAVFTLLGCKSKILNSDSDSLPAEETKPSSAHPDAGVPSLRVVPLGVGPTPQAEAARISPLVSGILNELGRSLCNGLRTKDLEGRAIELLRAADLDPRMLGFRAFPSAIAVSIDDEVLHGIPSERVLTAGQLVKIQVGGRTRAGTADQGWTFAVGPIDGEKARLCRVGVAALKDAIAVIKTGARTGDVGAAIQGTIEVAGFAAVRDFTGYGIGEKAIQDPQLPCVGVRGTGAMLTSGMVLHVHAIAVAGAYALITRPDKWTAATKDGRASVLFTAVVRVRPGGCDVLTPLLV